MRTIDEIYKLIDEDGIEALSPDELAVYIDREREIAAHDAAFAERQNTYAIALDATAQAQQELAKHAGDILDSLISNPPMFNVME